ncbi:hypothetical protein [Paroceanicella profunda]|uniref:hypothetical protein n=1 Tax=Paroceanicella profunda TaxID=2579971 RepID=UPI001478F02E|nr:hypothetical protein [Paroceanicella profunda]
MADVSGIPSGADLVQDGAPVDQVPFIAGLDAIRAAIIAVNADAVAAADLAGRASAIEATLTYRLINPQGGPNSLVYDIPATFTLDAMPLRGHYLFVAAHTNVGGGTYIRIRRYDGANYVNGTSTVILKRGSADLDPGDIVAGEVVMLMSLGEGPDSYRLIGTPRSDITEIGANIAEALEAIAAETAARTAAIASEAAARAAAHTTLQATIAAANTARADAVAALNTRIDNANTYRADNDALLQGRIDEAQETAAAATAAEAAARRAADTALEAALLDAGAAAAAAVAAETAAREAAVTDEATTRAAAVSAEATARAAADTGLGARIDTATGAIPAEAAARAAADTALGTRIDGAAAGLAALDGRMVAFGVTDLARPGEAPGQFSSTRTGDPVSRGPLQFGEIVVDAELGAILCVADARDIAWRRALAMERVGRVYRLRIGIKRLSDSVDPDGDAVEVLWQNLDLAKAAVSLVTLATWSNPQAEAGLQVVELLLSRDASIAGVDYLPPAPTRYGTPLVRTHGSDLTTGLAFFSWQDVTEAHLAALAQAGVAARLAALETLSIATLTVTPSGVQELGASVTPTLTWTYAGEGSIASVSVNGTAISAAATSYVAPAPITAGTSYTVQVTDTLGRTDSRSVTVPFQPRVFWGASASSSLNSAGIITLSGSRLQSNKTLFESIATAGGYAYFAYPASFGAPSLYRLFGFDEDPVSTTVSVTTAAGHTADYIVLRSPAPAAGAMSVEVS